MSKIVFFINDEGKIKEYFGDGNKKIFSQIHKIDCAYINSKKFNFFLSVFRKLSILDSFKAYLNEKKCSSWSKLFLDLKSNFFNKNSVKIIQKVAYDFEDSGVEHVCPIEFVISNWCFSQTDKWWVFLFKESTNDESFSCANSIYRIVTGIKKGVLISRFLKIKDEAALIEELLRTVLFIKRFDKTETVDLFTNLPVNLSKIDIFILRKFEENDVISMLLKFAKNNNIFYPVISKKKFFLNEKFIKRASYLFYFSSVLCGFFLINNVIQYQKKWEENQKTEQQIFSKSMSISKKLGIKNFENQINELLNFLRTINERNLVFSHIKNSANKLFQLNFDRLFYKNKTFYLRLIGVKEEEIKKTLGNTIHQKISAESKNILNFSFTNSKENKEVSQRKDEPEIIEIDL